jgi:hypothetical protein
MELLDLGYVGRVGHIMLFYNISCSSFDRTAYPRLNFNMIPDQTDKVDISSTTTPLHPTTTGIPQGSPLSPILYLYYNADLIKTYNQEPNTIATGYIDNVAILQWGSSVEETCKGIETTMQRATAWAKRHASVFALSKFQLTYHTKRRQIADISVSKKNQG